MDTVDQQIWLLNNSIVSQPRLCRFLADTLGMDVGKTNELIDTILRQRGQNCAPEEHDENGYPYDLTDFPIDPREIIPHFDRKSEKHIRHCRTVNFSENDPMYEPPLTQPLSPPEPAREEPYFENGYWLMDEKTSDLETFICLDDLIKTSKSGELAYLPPYLWTHQKPATMGMEELIDSIKSENLKIAIRAYFKFWHDPKQEEQSQSKLKEAKLDLIASEFGLASEPQRVLDIYAVAAPKTQRKSGNKPSINK